MVGCPSVQRLTQIDHPDRARRQSLSELRKNRHARLLLYSTTKYAIVSNPSHGNPARIATRIPSTHQVVAMIAITAAIPISEV